MIDVGEIPEIKRQVQTPPVKSRFYSEIDYEKSLSKKELCKQIETELILCISLEETIIDLQNVSRLDKLLNQYERSLDREDRIYIGQLVGQLSEIRFKKLNDKLWRIKEFVIPVRNKTTGYMENKNFWLWEITAMIYKHSMNVRDSYTVPKFPFGCCITDAGFVVPSIMSHGKLVDISSFEDTYKDWMNIVICYTERKLDETNAVWINSANHYRKVMENLLYDRSS